MIEIEHLRTQLNNEIVKQDGDLTNHRIYELSVMLDKLILEEIKEQGENENNQKKLMSVNSTHTYK